MPDITLPNTLVASATTVADEILENLYAPNTTPDSYDVINGFLDNPNRAAGADIHDYQIRSGSMSNGRQVGLTGNLDYVPAHFTEAREDVGGFQAIPGAGIEFTLPIDPTLVVFTWQVITALDNSFSGGTPALDPTLAFFLDGTELDLALRRDIPEATNVTAGGVRRRYRDRVWSGHHCAHGGGALTSGFHRAEVRVHSRANFLRVRIRNMKYVWFA
jgi:hypothetical protein